MTNSQIKIGAGMTFLLFIVFLVLRLVGVTGWSWWWVTSPLWIPAAIAVTITLIAVVAVIFEVKSRNRKKRA